MSRSAWVKLGLLILLVAGAGLLLQAFGVEPARFTPAAVSRFLRAFGVWAPAAYLLVYGQPFVPLPASIMIMVAGLVFGPWWGLAASVGVSTIRACNQYLVARWLGRETVVRLLKGRAAALDQRIGEHGFRAVLLIRLVPSVPYDVLNYGLGFSQVRLLPYAAGTLIGMTPICFAYVYFGHALTDPAQRWKLALAALLLAGLILLPRALKTTGR